MDGIEGFRCYGEQTLLLLESFVESKGKVDPEDFARRLEAKFGKASAYEVDAVDQEKEEMSRHVTIYIDMIVS